MGGTVISGFEYTYDDLSRIVEEKVLANSTKMCYTYDSLNRVTARTVKKLSDNSVVSTETFSHDAAGNVTGAPNSSFQYDTNNRLIAFNGNTVSYDLDGNMLSNGSLTCTYDSANRLVTAGGHTYTYNAEDVRIRNLCEDEDTTYTYNTNAKLSMLLMKTTGGVVTKYVYGRGLIGEESGNVFKTYHFDCRGSTIAITDASGNITDTFAYDTYGKLLSRTGTSKVIFGYNGRDGVVTDDNGLIYMRARYYSPEMKRFLNADIVAGQISNAVTLNRFAYANGNPVSFVDPFGLSPERRGATTQSNPVPLIAPDGTPWKGSGFVYDDWIRDFRLLKHGWPPYAFHAWLKSHPYYSVSYYSISGSVGNDIASASGGVSLGNAYAGVIDKGIGVEAGVAGATAEGNLSLGNLSLDGEANALHAEANAEFVYEDGFKLGAEAKASVATAEASFTIDLWFMEIEIGVEGDFLSAGAEASVTVGENDEGQFEIGAEAGIGALLFGLGLDISFIFG